MQGFQGKNIWSFKNRRYHLIAVLRDYVYSYKNFVMNKTEIFLREKVEIIKVVKTDILSLPALGENSELNNFKF